MMYGFEFFILLIQHRNWNLIYRNISFEPEAYTKEKDLEF